jgi:hypothetical protein
MGTKQGRLLMFTSFLHGQDTHLHVPHIFAHHTSTPNTQELFRSHGLPQVHRYMVSHRKNEKDIILMINTKLHKRIINNYPDAYFPSAHSCDYILSSPTSACYLLRSHGLSILRVLNNKRATTGEEIAIALQWREQISIFRDG